MFVFQLYTVLLSVENAVGHEKRQILKTFFQNICEQDRKLLTQILIPTWSYGLKEKQLLKIFSVVLKRNVETHFTELGDVYKCVLRELCNSNHIETLSLEDVLSFLQDLKNEKTLAGKIRLFKNIFSKCTSYNIDLLIRLSLQDLKIGIGKNVIQKCMNVSSDNPFIEPMLCRASCAYSIKDIVMDLYEVKYDGERVQIHLTQESCVFFSRNHKPTKPCKVENLEQELRKGLIGVDNIILDGELIPVDETFKPLPFGFLGNKKLQSVNGHIRVMIFDCLQLNGVSLLDIQLEKRHNILEKHIRESNIVKLSKQYPILNIANVEKVFVQAIQQGEEGIVLKSSTSTYQPGKRGWIKIKKDSMNGGSLIDTVDLLLIGASYGKGKKAGLLSSFILGTTTLDGHIIEITKCGSGFSLKDLADWTKTFHERLGTKTKPNNVKGNVKADWFTRETIIWTISASELSSINGVDVSSLRFPRFVRYRVDKALPTTQLELNEMFKHKNIVSIK